ncbi:DNA-binding transcriptional response regulator [Tsuneonella amylolytica]|uniref:response regulator transcription factor n=1 Tax=Tsuneonella amylolytica TaxID=2338327 RepID=UPI000EA965BE|nr:response regulator transcription factor [Tsuneonella amylolytica]
MTGSIALLVSDPAVLSSLQFALSVEGFQVSATGDNRAAAALVIDQGYRQDGVAALLELRARGTATPAIILVTNPNTAFRARAAAAGAALIEKPLLGDELSRAIAEALHLRKAA